MGDQIKQLTDRVHSLEEQLRDRQPDAPTSGSGDVQMPESNPLHMLAEATLAQAATTVPESNQPSKDPILVQRKKKRLRKLSDVEPSILNMNDEPVPMTHG